MRGELSEEEAALLTQLLYFPFNTGKIEWNGMELNWIDLHGTKLELNKMILNWATQLMVG